MPQRKLCTEIHHGMRKCNLSNSVKPGFVHVQHVATLWPFEYLCIYLMYAPCKKSSFFIEPIHQLKRVCSRKGQACCHTISNVLQYAWHSSSYVLLSYVFFLPAFFAQLYNLECHIQSFHDKLRPFSCTVNGCNRKYTTKVREILVSLQSSLLYNFLSSVFSVYRVSFSLSPRCNFILAFVCINMRPKNSNEGYFRHVHVVLPRGILLAGRI